MDRLKADLADLTYIHAYIHEIRPQYIADIDPVSKTVTLSQPETYCGAWPFTTLEAKEDCPACKMILALTRA